MSDYDNTLNEANGCTYTLHPESYSSILKVTTWQRTMFRHSERDILPATLFQFCIFQCTVNLQTALA